MDHVLNLKMKIGDTSQTIDCTLKSAIDKLNQAIILANVFLSLCIVCIWKHFGCSKTNRDMQPYWIFYIEFSLDKAFVNLEKVINFYSMNFMSNEQNIENA